jgi:hypothetical protein
MNTAPAALPFGVLPSCPKQTALAAAFAAVEKLRPAVVKAAARGEENLSPELGRKVTAALARRAAAIVAFDAAVMAGY